MLRYQNQTIVCNVALTNLQNFVVWHYLVIIELSMHYVIASRMSQPHFGLSVRVKPTLLKVGTLPKVGSWSPLGLPKTQSAIAGVKSLHIWALFMSLKRFWSVDVQNGLAWAIWTSVAQVMGKRRAGNQIGSLTPDH